MSTPRADQWKGLATEDVLRLVAYAIDQAEDERREDRRIDTEWRMRQEVRMNRIFFAVVGILCSVTAASIMLAINLGVIGSGGTP